MPQVNLKPELVALVNSNRAEILRRVDSAKHITMGHLVMVDNIIDALKADKDVDMSARALELMRERIGG